jgi:hypothetical protein
MNAGSQSSESAISNDINNCIRVEALVLKYILEYALKPGEKVNFWSMQLCNFLFNSIGK